MGNFGPFHIGLSMQTKRNLVKQLRKQKTITVQPTMGRVIKDEVKNSIRSGLKGSFGILGEMAANKVLGNDKINFQHNQPVPQGNLKAKSPEAAFNEHSKISNQLLDTIAHNSKQGFAGINRSVTMASSSIEKSLLKMEEALRWVNAGPATQSQKQQAEESTDPYKKAGANNSGFAIPWGLLRTLGGPALAAASFLLRRAIPWAARTLGPLAAVAAGTYAVRKTQADKDQMYADEVNKFGKTSADQRKGMRSYGLTGYLNNKLDDVYEWATGSGKKDAIPDRKSNPSDLKSIISGEDPNSPQAKNLEIKKLTYDFDKEIKFEGHKIVFKYANGKKAGGAGGGNPKGKPDAVPNTDINISTADQRYQDNVEKYGKEKADALRAIQDGRATDPLNAIKMLNPMNWFGGNKDSGSDTSSGGQQGGNDNNDTGGRKPQGGNKNSDKQQDTGGKENTNTATSIPSRFTDDITKMTLAGAKPHNIHEYMLSHGINLSEATCGQFMASVIKDHGGTPPKNPAIASNWNNFGGKEGEGYSDDPNAINVAVKQGARTGNQGSHVTSAIPIRDKDGKIVGFSGVGVNQGNPSGKEHGVGQYGRDVISSIPLRIGDRPGDYHIRHQIINPPKTDGDKGITPSDQVNDLDKQAAKITPADEVNDIDKQADAAPAEDVGHNAQGTSNWRGGPTWVGEKGPEIVNLPKGAEVIPNNRTKDMFGRNDRFNKELSDPAVNEKMLALTHAETGSQGPEAQQALMETIYNRASSRNKSLADTMNTAYYQPLQKGAAPYNKALAEIRKDPALAQKYSDMRTKVMGGTNIADFGTGNASGAVGFGEKGYETFNAGPDGRKERFGVEDGDLKWAKQMQSQDPNYLSKLNSSVSLNPDSGISEVPSSVQNPPTYAPVVDVPSNPDVDYRKYEGNNNPGSKERRSDADPDSDKDTGRVSWSQYTNNDYGSAG